MTPKELLQPRFKVIASYPFNNHFVIGNIITLDKTDDITEENYSVIKPLAYAGHAGAIQMNESVFGQYTHLFQKLKWWEARPVEEMPIWVNTAERKTLMIEKHFSSATATEQDPESCICNDGCVYLYSTLVPIAANKTPQ
jgi:hypothetical protein